MLTKIVKKRRDYIAMWFEVRNDMGISDTMNIGPMDKSSGSVSWHHFSHAAMDGVGGVSSILREQGYPCKELPKGSDRDEPSFFQLLRKKNPNKDIHPKNIKWKLNYPVGNDNSAAISTCYFDTETTNRIKRNAKLNKVALSTFALWALNKSISKNLLEANQSYYWFYPVNLRGAVSTDTDTGNFSSGVNVCVENNIKPRSLQQNIRQKLQSKEYWMTWKLAHIGKYIGKKGIKYLYKSMSTKNFYAGSFSFLGAWPLPDDDNPPQDPQQVWVSCGIGTKNYPVSTGIMEWHGQLSLGLKLHPWIADNGSITQKCLSDWQHYLLQEVNNNDLSE